MDEYIWLKKYLIYIIALIAVAVVVGLLAMIGLPINPTVPPP